MTITRTTRLLTSLACLGAVLASCSKSGMEPEGRGYVAFYTATDPSVNCVATKSDGGDDAIAITIYDSDNEVAWSCKDYSTVTEPIDLYTGIYTVTATIGTSSAAAFDEPFYSCTDKFTVYNQKITTLDLELTLDAVKATASFTDDFDTYFTRYDLTVDNGLGSLTFSKDSGTLDSEGYFSVTGELNYTLYLTNTDGTEFTISDSYTGVTARQYYAFSFSIEKQDESDEGAGIITIVVDDSLNEKDHTFYIDLSKPTVSVTSVSAWAEFATVSGSWSGDQPEDIAFEWREAGGTWTSAAAEVDEDSFTFSAEIRGLSPETEYEIKAVATDVDDSGVKTFTTEDEQTVPNLNFDSWYNTGKYDCPNEDADHIYWDTANGGTATANVYPTTQETDHVISNSAVRMESKSVLNVKLAAGNIYTGQFGSVSLLKMSATLDWGYEFSSRPLALKGYYDYSPATVDWAQDPYSDMKGSPDIGQIQIFLTDWDEPFTVDSGNEVFVDFDADYIIARGQLLITEDSGGEYQEFTLPLEYYDTTRTPTYIVITCSASAYGDYFTGGTGSTLYVDEFSLVYDPDELD